MARQMGVAILVLLAGILFMIGMSGDKGPVGEGSVVEALSNANPSALQQEIALRGTAVLGMVIFSLGVTLWGLRRGHRWAWWVLWYWPIFFVLHVLAFHTYVPDIPFAILAAVALVLTRGLQAEPSE
jgi:hypothetical protein